MLVNIRLISTRRHAGNDQAKTNEPLRTQYCVSLSGTCVCDALRGGGMTAGNVGMYIVYSCSWPHSSSHIINVLLVHPPGCGFRRRPGHRLRLRDRDQHHVSAEPLQRRDVEKDVIVTSPSIALWAFTVQG
jgi:hypothetical protein